MSILKVEKHIELYSKEILAACPDFLDHIKFYFTYYKKVLHIFHVLINDGYF